MREIFWARARLTDRGQLHPRPDPLLHLESDPHTDGPDADAAASNITIRHNRVYGGYINQYNFGNSAITSGGGVRNFLVDEQPACGWWADVSMSGGVALAPPSDSDNRFSRVFVGTVGGFGPIDGCSPVRGGRHTELAWQRVPRDGAQPLTRRISPSDGERQSAQISIAVAAGARSSAAQPSARIPRRTGTGHSFLIVCAPAERDANSRNNC